MDGESYGVEVAATWSPVDYWKLSLGYTFLKMHLSLDRSSSDTSSKSLAGDHPQNQFHLRSYLDLPHNLKLDAAIYYVDHVPNQDVRGYTRADLRLGWSPIRNLDLALVFQNLFDPRHREFGSGFLINPTKIERSVYGKITWRF
jgi:iron complex outermembrane receptor protein